ncbi:transcription/translation regulatory transformer protein RfaH [Psychromonas antarctica]|uniref:transcription/translation regulatory transformer protein RfaH n=1 Tax=Psychromonas antarctica TaxID=67573 RepID=UPI001EE9A79A|nr:transcription/translation regulatory transformer protein RfaH [Psychromonas antarctica]MCG6201844.1 transcription/translation regulatory transformer protein RfaH [Psychromonas antarctica]
MNKEWFVVYCKSREELRAQQNLENQGIHSFFPKICKEKMIRGKKTIVTQALFPNYLFIFISQDDRNFTRIRSTRGINDFVRFGKEIAIASPELIKHLQAICHSINDLKVDTSLRLKSGDKVEVLSGAFKGLAAIFSEQDGLQRSILLLNVLNQENKISFSNKDIKKLNR